MIAARSFFCTYLLIRVAEASELGHVVYRETQNPLTSITVLFIFLFALTIVVHGVRVLGESIALRWHLVMEFFLLFLSVYWAATCALTAGATTQSLFGNWTTQHRFMLFSGLFLCVQAVLAMAGAHIIRWMIKQHDL